MAIKKQVHIFLKNALIVILILGMTFPAMSFARDYSVTDELSADIFIDRISSDYDGGLDAVYKLLNKTQDEIGVTAIFTAYDNDGKMMKKVSENHDLTPDVWKEISLTLSLSEDELANCSKVKAMVWRTSDRKPLSYAVTKTDLYTSVRDTLAKASLFGGFDVKLTGDSYLKEQLEIGADYLKYYDVDRLAASLYVNNMKSKSPGQVYGGWEGGGLPGHSVGHYLSACVSMYMQTGDEDFKNRVERLVYLIGEAQYDDGYVGGVSKSNMDNVFANPDTFWAGGHNNAYLDGMWAPWYSIHKVLAGLIDAYTYMGNEDALRIAQGMADYAKNGTDNLSADRMDYMLEGEYGGINESFAQLYEITGNEDYLVLARRFSHKRIMDPLSRGEDNLSGLHANTQIPKMIGAAKIYQLTGDEYYKNVAENFWHYVVYDRSYATGGNCDKEFFTDLGTEPRSVDSTETCNVYNMLKLTEYLYSMDPKTEYLEFYENALYNHILGSQNPTGDKTYNIDLTMGGHKNYKRHCQDFSCCEGTGMENPGRFYRMIYTKEDEGLCVNLFVDSRLDYKEKGIIMQQTTDFPYSDESVISFEEAEGKNVPVRIRIPSWTVDPSIKVNDEAVDVEPSEDGYVTITKAWETGDEIKLTMPMDYSLYVSREDKQGKIVAFKYGPILLAGEPGNSSVPYIVTDTRDPSKILTRDSSGNLRFSIDGLLKPGNKSITLKPFFEFVSENHMVYWNLYTNAQYDSLAGAGETFADRLDSATYDKVQPNDAQSESAHNLQVEGTSQSGTWQNKGWRSVEDFDSFSYDLKVHSTSANYLLSVFYGDEYSNYKTRTFDIFVDNELLATYSLEHNRPNDLWEYYYIEIPSRLTAGKDKVTVSYCAGARGYTAGGVFEVRTVSTELYPYAVGQKQAGAIKGVGRVVLTETQLELSKSGLVKSDIKKFEDAGSDVVNTTIVSQDTIRFDVNNEALGDNEISVICYSPGWNKDIDNWMSDEGHIAYMDQYSLKGGKGSYEIKLNDSIENGGYTLAIGTSDGSYVKDIIKSSEQGNNGDNENGTNDGRTPSIIDKAKDGNTLSNGNEDNAVGVIFIYKNLRYKITKKAPSFSATGEVTVTGVKSKKKSIVVPPKIKRNGYSYTVVEIGAKAFRNNKKVKIAKIGKNVRKIGAEAFSGCKKLKKIVFKTTKLKKKSIGAGAFNGINANAVVKVSKKVIKRYRTILKTKGMKGSKIHFFVA